ncbi:hypothetical protein DVH24_007980 [Malus domestica]|uniref:Secreted protein n=1 Tax=Malus domestica TaxID=3750 RepID=A0A498JIV7_MALDO|nr:hypothetical protein DVH24_007980 [Malus domestica]
MWRLLLVVVAASPLQCIQPLLLLCSMVEKRTVVPEDAGLQIVTEILDQKFSRHHGKVVRCMGKAGVRETSASSSRSSTGKVNALKEEVTTLKG